MSRKKSVTTDASVLSNIEAAIMGLLSEGTRYGYELEKIIEQRHMRYWTEIGFSSIYYVLKRLEGRKLIRSELKASTEGKPQRKIYTMTTAGKTAFKSKIQSLLSENERVVSPFDLAITFCAALDKAELSDCFEKRLEFLGKRLEWVQERVNAGRVKGRPIGVTAKFERHAALIKAEQAWTQGLIRDLKKN